MTNLSPSRQTEKSEGLNPSSKEKNLDVGSTPTWDTAVTINPFDEPIEKVYGPYEVVCGSGDTKRRLLTFVLASGRKTSMTYARWAMTQHLGRVLTPEEHVDHVNEDALDDRIDNYQLLTPSEHTTKSQTGRESPIRGIEKGWTHGTVYGWMKKKCPCEECQQAKRQWHDTRNESRRLGDGEGQRGGYGKQADHGSRLSYTRGCRCDRCRAANALGERKRRAGEEVPDSKKVIT